MRIEQVGSLCILGVFIINNGSSFKNRIDFVSSSEAKTSNRRKANRRYKMNKNKSLNCIWIKFSNLVIRYCYTWFQQLLPRAWRRRKSPEVAGSGRWLPEMVVQLALKISPNSLSWVCFAIHEKGTIREIQKKKKNWKISSFLFFFSF